MREKKKPPLSPREVTRGERTRLSATPETSNIGRHVGTDVDNSEAYRTYIHT
jgi:hypothetical protein